MAIPMSACVAYVLFTKFNERNDGPAITFPHICELFGFPGIPSENSEDPVPTGLTPASSASIRRMIDAIAADDSGADKISLYAKAPDHKEALAEYRRWFKSTISRKLNQNIDKVLGDTSILHIIEHSILPVNTDPNPEDDGIFDMPTLLDWHNNPNSHWTAAKKLGDEFDDYIMQGNTANRDINAEQALFQIVRNVWSRHQKAWQRARAVVFGITSSNARTTPEGTMWHQLVEVMKSKCVNSLVQVGILSSSATQQFILWTMSPSR